MLSNSNRWKERDMLVAIRKFDFLRITKIVSLTKQSIKTRERLTFSTQHLTFNI